MECVTISVLGNLVVLHPDDPSPEEVRSRLVLLLQAPLPPQGVVRILPGSHRDEVRWQTLAVDLGHGTKKRLLTGSPTFPVART